MNNTGNIKTTVKKITQYTVAVLAWLLFLYTVTGYYLIPAGIRYYLANPFAEQAKHRVKVDEVRFDPFRFDFYLAGFRICNDNDKPLLLLDSLFIDYDPQTLFDGQYAIESVELGKPYFDLALDARGKSELLALLDNLLPPATTPAPAPASPTPALWIKQLGINGAHFDVSTQQFNQPLQQHIRIKRLELHDFHTTDNGHANRFRLIAVNDEQSMLELDTTVRLEPLQLTGKLAVTDVQLQPIIAALDALPGYTLQPLAMDFSTRFVINGQTLQDIKLDDANIQLRGFSLSPVREKPSRAEVPVIASTHNTVSIKHGKDVLLKNGHLLVQNIAVYSAGEEKPLVVLPALAVDKIRVNTRKQTVTVNNIALSDGEQFVVMDKTGAVNLQALLAGLLPPEPVVSAPAASVPAPPAPASKATASTAAALSAPAPAAAAKQASPWKVTIGNLAVKNNRVHYRSEQATLPLDIELYPVNIAVQQFKPLEPGVPFPLQMQVNMVNGGNMQLDATVNVDALAGSGQVVLKDIPLYFAQPVVDTMALVDIKTGALDGQIQFTANAKTITELQASGEVNVHDVSVYKKNSKKKVVSWHELAMHELQFALPENRLAIKHLVIDKSYARFTLNADGTTNVQDLMLVQDNIASNDSAKTEAGVASDKTARPQPETVVKADSPPLQFDIGLITLKDAEIGFSDLSLNPSFRVAMKQLNGDIKGMSSSPESNATVNLHGKVDRYAPVDIAGTFNVFSEKLQMDMGVGFKNIELTTFTPYSGVYAGYAIDSGKMNLDLHYSMVNDKVQGKNHIVINQLKLGEKVKSDKATSLPVKLAVALLRDENGVIDLGFEVNGNIDDPQFSINKIFFKAIKDVIVKATKAPFKFFAGLFKSKQKNVQELPFAAGSDAINTVIADKLQLVAQMMDKRQALHLNVHGNAAADEDTPALQEQHLINTLATQNAIDKAAFLPTANPAMNPAIYAVLAAHYKTNRAEDIADVEERMSEELFKKGEKPDEKLIKQRSYDEAWQDLVDATVITPADIQALAAQRAAQVKKYLVDKFKISPDRISVVENGTDEKPSLVTRLGLDANGDK